MIHRAKTLLKDVFGYDEFRPLQEDVIANVLRKRDTLVIMPTGGGKSLCYQIPALLFPGLTVVVSPLIALMKDQVEQLRELGIGAVYLNSSLSYDEYRHNVARIMRNEIKLLYVAPETLLMQKTLALLANQQVECLTIDEAHCISEWGHDFRPEYRQLAQVRSYFPNAVCAAFTATATPRVQQDIKISLGVDDANEFIASFDRKNLFLQVAEKVNPVWQTVNFLKKFPDQSGLIYCFSRRQVDELAALLASEGFSVKPYHAGLSDAERRRNQELFIRDDVQIIVATVAFGMGINKPNIRFVIHYDLPQNIESYYQQIGRAGRDGLQAHCLLLFGYGDIRKVQYFISQKSDTEQRVAAAHLQSLLGLLETDECRRRPLLAYFGERYTAPACGMCDNCASEARERIDLTIPAQKFLSCVKRTGEMFGAGHVIDVLLGSQAQKVLKFGHQTLSTYGIGREYSRKQWQRLSRQFLQKGLMSRDMSTGSLKLTQKAWAVFRGEEQVLGRVDDNGQEAALAQGQSLSYDQDLYEALRQQRKQLADEHNMPPYIIFPDITLMEMAAYFPQQRESLLQIQGVGTTKLAHYGDIFLHIIQTYCQEHGLQERPKMPPPTLSGTTRKLRHIEIGEAYNAGKSVNDLMAAFGVKQSTVLNHLFKYLQEGHELTGGRDFLTSSTLSEEQQQIVLRMFTQHGAERLRPVFDALDGHISYDDLHLLRLYYLTHPPQP